MPCESLCKIKYDKRIKIFIKPIIVINDRLNTQLDALIPLGQPTLTASVVCIITLNQI